MQDSYRPHSGVEGSNVPGNPLRSYRMSMLAHGFVDDGETEGFGLDESDPATYSVVRLRPTPLATAAVVALFVMLITIGVLVTLT